MASITQHDPYTPDYRAEFLHARHYRRTHEHQLPDTTFWRKLERRWEINPHRFTHWHPIVGRWIAEDHRLDLRHQQPLPPTINYPPPVNHPGSSGGVSEPGSGVLMLLAIVCIWIWQDYTRLKSQLHARQTN